MNKLARMLFILVMTIAGSGSVSGFDKLDRFMKRENRRFYRIEKRNLRHERCTDNANTIQEKGRRSQDIKKAEKYEVQRK
jgi:hypothetical protein